MRTLLAVLGLLTAIAASADQSAKFGDVEVHYNAMPTSDLLPEVAKAYAIERSKTRGLLTVSVLKKNRLGVAEPIMAKIKASAVNQYAQLIPIDMREIKEGSAIYYLGVFRVAPPDTYVFSLEIMPAGKSKPLKTEFRRQFFQ
jgi:Domain of unknown function (DUF4426)